MSIPAWTVMTWPPVLATVTEFDRALHEMRQTSACTNRDGDLRNYGQVLWSGDIDGRQIGIAWDWAEVSPRVVAMSDPMSVLSNLILFGDDGTLLDGSARVVRLNTAIHELPWQAQIAHTHEVPHALAA